PHRAGRGGSQHWYPTVQPPRGDLDCGVGGPLPSWVVVWAVLAVRGAAWLRMWLLPVLGWGVMRVRLVPHRRGGGRPGSTHPVRHRADGRSHGHRGVPRPWGDLVRHG